MLSAWVVFVLPTQLWFRVERQLTIPFRTIGGALFVIRTYRYPVTSLTTQQREDVRLAMEQMPERIARYKGLFHGREHVLAMLRHV